MVGGAPRMAGIAQQFDPPKKAMQKGSFEEFLVVWVCTSFFRLRHAIRLNRGKNEPTSLERYHGIYQLLNFFSLQPISPFDSMTFSLSSFRVGGIHPISSQGKVLVSSPQSSKVAEEVINYTSSQPQRCGRKVAD